MKGKITAARRAGAQHQVLSVEGMGPHRREPCGGCPWRIDQTGKFPTEAFRISADTAYDGAIKLFGCHESGATKPATCAGFLLRNSAHNIGARIRGVAGGPGCFSQVPLHASYRAMAIANGVDPDDPVLAPCRADDDGPAARREGRR